MATKKKRILIIGLDGFTWNLWESFTDKGIMPNLAGLVGAGCHGTLRSVIPYETGPAWSSFQTGCYPEKTGIYAFHGYSKDTRQIKLNSFNEIKVPTIWELLSAEGKRVISINMPETSPAPKINGIMIPGFTCPGLSSETVYPPEIYEQYIKPNPDYLILDNRKRETLSEYVTQAINVEENRCNLALELMQKFEWDLFSVQIQSTDTFQHQNWWALDPEAEGYTEEAYFQASKFYQHIDNVAGKLVEATGESTLIIVASDHGFCAKKADISINAWLNNNGFLCLKDTRPESSFHSTKEKLKNSIPPLKYLAGVYGKTSKFFSRCLNSLDHRPQRDKLAELYTEKVVRHIREMIDLDHTSAFCLGGMGEALYLINDAGKDKADEILSLLLKTYGPDSPEPLIAEINPVENPKNLPYLPDYLVTFLPGVEARINPEGSQVVMPGVVDGKQRGTHERDGIFVLCGPGTSNLSFDSDIVDIAPTMLSYLSTPIPKHMDGAVLSQAFKEPLDIRYQSVDITENRKTEYSNDDQSVVEKQLKDLGYL